MLQKMRSGAQSLVSKILLFGILLLAMVGLAFTDVQGMFRSGGPAATGTIAKINNQKISSAEFDVLVQRNMRQQNLSSDPSFRRVLPMIVLNQEINARIYAQAAHDLGLIVDNKTAATRLKQDLLAPIAQQAGLSEKEALTALLRNTGTSERAFVASFKSQIATEQLLGILTAGARAPQKMIDDALKRRYEWRRGEYFELTAADLSDALKTPATDEELQQYYETIAGSFLLPEYRDFSVLLIDRQALGLGDGKPTAEEIEEYYRTHSADMGTPEQRQIEQLIAPDEATAKALLAEAAAGATLADIAKAAKAQKDTPASKTIFASSTYTRDELDLELAGPAFDAAPNAVAGPVQTPLGWHILKIASVTPGRVPPLAEVRADLEKEMMEDTNAEALYQRATEIDEMVANGQSLSAIAAELKIDLVTFSDVTSEGITKDGKKLSSTLPALPKIIETAFTLDEGQTSQLTETSDGAFLLIEANRIVPAKEQPFEDVRAEVAESLRLKKMGELFDQRSAEITEKMQLGESFAAVANRLGKKVRSTDLLQRASTPAESGIERGMLPALFSLDKVGQTTAVSGNEKVTILRLSERKIERPRTDKPDDRAALKATLDEAVKNDILEQYRAYLMDKYDVTINEDLISRIYAPSNEDAILQ